jgi:hypothetical protein
MTVDTKPTALLLDLAARAQDLDTPAALPDLLAEGHRAWRAGAAEVRAGIEQETALVSDSQVAQRSATAGVAWEAGMTRSEAIAELVFAGSRRCCSPMSDSAGNLEVPMPISLALSLGPVQGAIFRSAVGHVAGPVGHLEES